MREEIVVNNVTYFVSKPKADDEAKAKFQQNKVFAEALKAGALLRKELNKDLVNRKIVSEQDEKDIEEITDKIRSNVEKLENGGIEILEARKLAIETSKLRSRLLILLASFRDNDSYTVEGQAENAYFDALVSRCCFNDKGEKLFSSYEDYILKSKEDYAVACARKLSEIIYGLSEDFYKDLPENKFLEEYGFINEKLEFVDESGNVVDENYETIKVEEEVKPEKKPFLKNGEPIVK